MAAYHRVDDCGLTACTLGSTPSPTLSNEYGEPLPFYMPFTSNNSVPISLCCVVIIVFIIVGYASHISFVWHHVSAELGYGLQSVPTGNHLDC